MKAVGTWAVVGFAIGIGLTAFGQDPRSIIGQPAYTTQSTGMGTTSQNATGAAPAGTPDQEKQTEESDSSLYRGRTDEMESNMIRDEGMLHFKTRPKEKDQKVDSLKNLQSSGTDPKFQGEFAISGVNSINQIAAKANVERAPAAEGAPAQSEDRGDSRFARKHLTFTPQGDDKPKKAEAESTPSPTPTPSASPAAKSTSDSKK